MWEIETYPEEWTKSLMQPLYKGGGKDKKDPASYRGICLTCATTKLLEGIINSRLTSFLQQSDTLTRYQFGGKKGCQTHDETHLLTAIARNNATLNNSPTFCAFIDFSTTNPATHRACLTRTLHRKGLRGKMWRVLQETYHTIKIRVLHPLILE